MKRYSYIFIVLLAVLFCFPVYGQPPEKKVAVLLPIDRQGNVNYFLKAMVKGELTNAVVAMPGYGLYERTDIDAIFEEQAFQRTGHVSDEQKQKMGGIKGVAYVIVSEVVQSGKDVYIEAKLMLVETGGVEKFSKQRCSENPEQMEKGCLELVRKLFGQGGTYGNNDGNGVSGYGVQTQSKKQTIAICVMRDNSDTKIVSYAKFFASELQLAVSRSAKYNAVERTGKFLELLSREQSYQRTGQVDESKIVELGKLEGVNFVLSVDMTDFGNNSIYVVWKLIDVETAVIQYGDLELKRIVNMVADLKALSEAIAKKITG